FPAKAGSDAAAVLVIAPVDDVMGALQPPTADGRRMTMGNLEDKICRNFCSAVGRVDCVTERENRPAEFRRQVARLFETKTQSEWMEFFQTWTGTSDL